MAKKMPKTDTSTIEETKTEEKKDFGKASVNVDSKNGSKSNKKVADKNNSKKKSDKPNIFQKIGKGIKGIFSELKKVTWPKGKDVLSNTAVVLTVVVVFFVVLFIIDYVLSGLLGVITTGKWATMFI